MFLVNKGGNGAKRAIDWMKIEGTGSCGGHEVHAQMAVGLSVDISDSNPQGLIYTTVY